MDVVAVMAWWGNVQRDHRPTMPTYSHHPAHPINHVPASPPHLIQSTTGGIFQHMRARDLGIIIGSLPTGPHNAITDVSGIKVGMTTIIEGDGPLTVGCGPIRTG